MCSTSTAGYCYMELIRICVFSSKEEVASAAICYDSMFERPLACLFTYLHTYLISYLDGVCVYVASIAFWVTAVIVTYSSCSLLLKNCLVLVFVLKLSLGYSKSYLACRRSIWSKSTLYTELCDADSPFFRPATFLCAAASVVLIFHSEWIYIHTSLELITALSPPLRPLVRPYHPDSWSLLPLLPIPPARPSLAPSPLSSVLPSHRSQECPSCTERKGLKRPGKPLRFPRNVLKLDGYCGIHCPPTSIIDPDIQTKVETETERQGDGERLTLKDTQERERHRQIQGALLTGWSRDTRRHAE